jgi:hypothetical protein
MCAQSGRRSCRVGDPAPRLSAPVSGGWKFRERPAAASLATQDVGNWFPGPHEQLLPRWRLPINRLDEHKLNRPALAVGERRISSPSGRHVPGPMLWPASSVEPGAVRLSRSTSPSQRIPDPRSLSIVERGAVGDPAQSSTVVESATAGSGNAFRDVRGRLSQCKVSDDPAGESGHIHERTPVAARTRIVGPPSSASVVGNAGDDRTHRLCDSQRSERERRRLEASSSFDDEVAGGGVASKRRRAGEPSSRPAPQIASRKTTLPARLTAV